MQLRECTSSEIGPGQIHFSGVNFEDVKTGILIRRWELNFPVNATRPEQGRVKNVNPVCRHDHLKVLIRSNHDAQNLLSSNLWDITLMFFVASKPSSWLSSSSIVL